MPIFHKKPSHKYPQKKADLSGPKYQQGHCCSHFQWCALPQKRSKQQRYALVVPGGAIPEKSTSHNFFYQLLMNLRQYGNAPDSTCKQHEMQIFTNTAARRLSFIKVSHSQQNYLFFRQLSLRHFVILLLLFITYLNL